MRFKYKAYTPFKKIIESEVEADSTAEVLDFLSKKNLIPITLKPIKEVKNIQIFGKPQISISDKVWLTKYLSLMLKSGIGLLSAIKILKVDYNKAALKNFLEEVQLNLEKGQPFYLSFAKYKKSFGDVFVNLIRAGEESGNLGDVLNKISVSLEREAEFNGEIKSALIYPIFLLVLSTIIVFFLSMFAIPKISAMFKGLTTKPPLFSRVVFSTGDFISRNGIMITLLIIIGGGGFFFAYKRSEVFRKFFYNLVIKIGIIKNLIKKIAIARFSSTLSSLVKAGIPMTKGLEITASSVGNDELKESLLRISNEGLKKGLTISEAFNKEPFFPKTITGLISIAEKSGQLEETLSIISGFYEKEVSTTLKRLMVIVEPILLLIIGTIVAFIALAVIIPVYQMVKQI